VRFPMPAQLRQVEWDGPSSNPSNVGGTALSEMVAVSDVGVQTDTYGNGFFNGAVVANAALTPAPVFTGPYYGVAVIAQQTPHAGVPSPTAQPGELSVLNGVLVGSGQLSPDWT